MKFLTGLTVGIALSLVVTVVLVERQVQSCFEALRYAALDQSDVGWWGVADICK